MTQAATDQTTWQYPAAKRDDSIGDVYPGDRRVPDPYRWLEDPDAKETEAFVDGQNEVTAKYLAGFKDSSALRQAVEGVFSYEKFSCPNLKKDGFYYWSYNPALLNQAQIWRSRKIDRSEPELFFDPNLLSDDGTISLGSSAFSKDGKYFAYSISKSGSDNNTIWVKETTKVDTLERLSDEISYVKFSGISWSKDSLGFVYQRFPEKDNSGRGTAKDINALLYYHKLGTAQKDDLLLHQDPEHPHHMFGGQVSVDGKYLIISTSQGTEHKNMLTLVKLGDDLAVKADMKKLSVVDDFHASFDYVVNYGSTFIFQTNEDAPRGKLVSLDVDNISAGFTDLISESADVLSDVTPFDNTKLICTYTHDVKDEVSIYDCLTGKFERKLSLPLGLAVYGVSCNYDSTDGFFIPVGGFTTPMSIYRFDNAMHDVSVYRETQVEGIDPQEYETEQVFYPSEDGTMIPMFITGRKDLPKDGSTPLLQYGYGGFEIPVTPAFSPLWIVLMKHFGARVAVVNIRGGGEYGQAWWSAAIRERRQVAYTDFQCASRYLIAKGYTSPSKLAIYGGSNGGLLVGVCLNQAPELYGAVMAAVGVLDMLRFHKFTIGAAWISDFGDPEESVAMFNAIRAYSPLHNVAAAAATTDKPYPATLLLTADHDDRVVACHTLKFAATLQYQLGQDNPNPLLARIETKAGHGAGKPTWKRVDEVRDQLIFLSLALGIPFK